MDVLKAIRKFDCWIDSLLLNYENVNVHNARRLEQCNHKISSRPVESEPVLDQVLLNEIESALVRASLTLPQNKLDEKCKQKKPTPAKDTIPIECNAAKSKQDQITSKSSCNPNLEGRKPSLSTHKPKLKYVPAHQKAPFKTFSQSKRIVERESLKTDFIGDDYGPQDITYNQVNFPIKADLVLQENKEPLCPHCTSEFEVMKRQRILQERQIWKIFLILKEKEMDNDRELLLRTLYSKCDQNHHNALVINVLLNHCVTLNQILQQLDSVMDYFDVEKATGDQLTWARHILTRLFHSAHRIQTAINMTFRADLVGAGDSERAKSELELWLEPRKKRTNFTPTSNGYFRYYLTAGFPITNKVFSLSRLAALSGTTKTGLYSFSGSLTQARDFIRLWTELEEKVVMAELLHTIEHSDLCSVLQNRNCSDIRTDVPGFRQLHGLLCGSTPVALQDTFML